MIKPKRGETAYSEKIKGARENYDWPARFDWNDGTVGITQCDQRVLLSKGQVRELLAFIKECGR